MNEEQEALFDALLALIPAFTSDEEDEKALCMNMVQDMVLNGTFAVVNGKIALVTDVDAD